MSHNNIDWEHVANEFAYGFKSSIASIVKTERLNYRANRTSNDVISLRNRTFTCITSPSTIELQAFGKGLSGIFRLQKKS